MNKENTSPKKLQKEFIELNQRYEDLVKNQKLKDDLIIMLVHDLKSPLLNLIGNFKTGYHEIENILEHLSKKEQPDLGQHRSSLEKHLKCLSSANSDAQVLWRRVTNLLDINKMEENQMHLELAEFDIKGLVEEAVSDMKMMADHNGVKVIVKNLPEKMLIYSDYDLILRVLTNIISNAIKHSAKDMEGKEKVNLTVKDDGEYLRFKVLDSGQGIPEAFRKLLFEKFTQLKRVKGSTGLGLTFSKLAVETLNGKIDSKNVENEGALFYFTIPKRYKQNESTEEKTEVEQWKFD